MYVESSVMAADNEEFVAVEFEEVKLGRATGLRLEISFQSPEFCWRVEDVICWFTIDIYRICMRSPWEYHLELSMATSFLSLVYSITLSTLYCAIGVIISEIYCNLQ